MKLHLDNNIVEGTPEELVKYQELLEEKEKEEELLKSGHMHEADDDAPMGYVFWYIDGTQGRRNNVLKATLDGDFEDSTGTVYTPQAVSGLIKPITNKYARKHFEEAESYGYLLKYYSTVDEFTLLKH